MKSFVAVETAPPEVTLDDDEPERPELILELRDKDGRELHLVLEGAALRQVVQLALAVREQFPAVLGGH